MAAVGRHPPRRRVRENSAALGWSARPAAAFAPSASIGHPRISALVARTFRLDFGEVLAHDRYEVDALGIGVTYVSATTSSPARLSLPAFTPNLPSHRPRPRQAASSDQHLARHPRRRSRKRSAEWRRRSVGCLTCSSRTSPTRSSRTPAIFSACLLPNGADHRPPEHSSRQGTKPLAETAMQSVAGEAP